MSFLMLTSKCQSDRIVNDGYVFFLGVNRTFSDYCQHWHH